jgi:hypothetical protein
MLINQLIRLSPDDDTKIIEAENNPFDLPTRGQFDRHMLPIPSETIEKLILDINLILQHTLGPPPPQKDSISRNIFRRSVDSSRQ